ILIKANPPGRRGFGFGGGAGARQRQFADFRRKWAGEAPEARPEEPKPEGAVDPSMTRYEGTGTGGRVADGVPVELGVNLKDPAKVTGNFGYPGYRMGPLKDATYSEQSHELKFKWEGPGGESDYTLIVDGDTFKGERKLPDDGGVMTYAGKKAAPEAKTEA